MIRFITCQTSPRSRADASMALARGWNAPPRLHTHLPALLFLQCAAAFIHLPFHPTPTCSSLRISPQARPGTRILRAAAAGARCEAWKPLPIEVEKPPASTAIIGGGPAGVSFSSTFGQRLESEGISPSQGRNPHRMWEFPHRMSEQANPQPNVG